MGHFVGPEKRYKRSTVQCSHVYYSFQAKISVCFDISVLSEASIKFLFILESRNCKKLILLTSLSFFFVESIQFIMNVWCISNKTSLAYIPFCSVTELLYHQIDK